MKIYTRKGDGGQTGIWGGRRLSNAHVRVEAIGAVDECNAAIGSALTCALPQDLAAILESVQMRLFVVGSELMAPDHAGGGSSVPRLTGQDVTDLELVIDSLEQSLPELRNFILPGGAPSAAALHLARGTCRRAERRVTTLSEKEGAIPFVSAFLNRLADLLFVAARYANHAVGVADIVWSGQSGSQVVLR